MARLRNINLIEGVKSFLKFRWGKLIATSLLLLILYYFFGLNIIYIIIPHHKSVDSIINSCSNFITVEKCPNGDWVVGRNFIHVDGTVSVFNKYGFLVYEYGPWTGTHKSFIGKLRKILGKESGCSESESIHICKMRN